MSSPREPGIPEQGSPRYVQRRSSILVRRAIGTFGVACFLFFAGLLVMVPNRLGSFAIVPAWVNVTGAVGTLALAATTRRLVLFDHGFSVPRVRFTELLVPRVVLPYGAVVSAQLSRGEGIWVWRVFTRDERRLIIPEWVFEERAVHDFLTSKWPNFESV